MYHQRSRPGHTRCIFTGLTTAMPCPAGASATVVDKDVPRCISGVAQGHGLLGARVDEVVEPSHELLVHVVEAEGVSRAAFAANLEVDGVVDVPVLFRVLFGDPVPALGGMRALTVPLIVPLTVPLLLLLLLLLLLFRIRPSWLRAAGANRRAKLRTKIKHFPPTIHYTHNIVQSREFVEHQQIA